MVKRSDKRWLSAYVLLGILVIVCVEDFVLFFNCKNCTAQNYAKCTEDKCGK